MSAVKSMKTFIFLWITQGLSELGSAVSYFTIIMWLTQYVYPNSNQKAELTFALTVLSLVYFIPRVAISPIAGVWVDRFDRKKIMIVADFMQGLISIFLVLSFLWLDAQFVVWLIFLLGGCISLLSTIHGLALSSSYIMIVPEKHLNRSSSMMTTMLTLTGVIAPLVSASILSLSKSNGVFWVFVINAVTFVISGFCLLFLKIPSPNQNNFAINNSPSSFWLDLTSGMVYLLKHPSFLWLLFLTFTMNIVYCSEILLPIIVKDILSGDWSTKGWSFQYAYAFLETVGFIGGTIAGVFMSWWGGLNKKQIYGVLVPLLISGLMIICFGLSKGIYTSALFLFIRMFVSIISGSHEMTIWRKAIPPEFQGRVFGLKSFVLSIATPIGSVLVGILGAKLGGSTVFVIMGILLVFVVVIQFFNKGLTQVGKF